MHPHRLIVVERFGPDCPVHESLRIRSIVEAGKADDPPIGSGYGGTRDDFEPFTDP
jgi:hypothetical protein